MTISEHLQFSVLTAPVASVDRRSLSQAWYSALYGTQQQPRPEKNVRLFPAKAQRGKRAKVQPQQEGTARAQSTVNRRSARQNVQVVPGHERRAPRSILSRKIERVFLQPKAPVRKASFALDSAAGRVQILLNANGNRVRLVAICPQKARSEVASALAQARYALASRGIELSSDVREFAVC
jgi:hypothetical protein